MGTDSHTPHEHNHDTTESSASTTRLAAVAILNLCGFFAELAGGLLFGSVALLSDAVHMLFDAIAYSLAFTAAAVAANYDISDKWSYGLHRLEPLSAFLNGVLLFPMVGYILYESYSRLLNPVFIYTVPTLAVALLGLIINVLCIWVLHDDELSLNERGALYHLLGDTGGSVAVIIAIVTIQVTGAVAVDAFVAVTIALGIIWSALRLLKGSGEIFLHASPVRPSTVREALNESVTSVVDVHVWAICSEITVATVHAHADVESVEEMQELTHIIHERLREVGIDHATVEVCPGNECQHLHLQEHSH